MLARLRLVTVVLQRCAAKPQRVNLINYCLIVPHVVFLPELNFFFQFWLEYDVVIPRQCRQCASHSQNDRLPAASSAASIPMPSARSSSSTAGPSSANNKKIHQHRARVEHRELQHPAQERAFTPFSLTRSTGNTP